MREEELAQAGSGILVLDLDLGDVDAKVGRNRLGPRGAVEQFPVRQRLPHAREGIPGLADVGIVNVQDVEPAPSLHRQPQGV